MNIYTIDKNEYGNNYDEIVNSIISKNGIVTVQSNSSSIPFDRAPKFFKRFDLIALNKMANSITQLVIEED